MTVQFIGVIENATGNMEPNRFANKHLFILSESISYLEMQAFAKEIAQQRGGLGILGSVRKLTYGGKASKFQKNTLLITNHIVYEQMKAHVEEYLKKDDKHFHIPVSNGLILTAKKDGTIESTSGGSPAILIASARIRKGVKDVYHFTGWSKDTSSDAAEAEFLIPWWMDLHDHETPDELSPTGLSKVTPRA